MPCDGDCRQAYASGAFGYGCPPPSKGGPHRASPFRGAVRKIRLSVPRFLLMWQFGNLTAQLGQDEPDTIARAG
jgi:hypothetical protein